MMDNGKNVMKKRSENIIAEFESFINEKSYPCVAARAAISRGHVPCFIAADIRSDKDDEGILQFIYDFISHFRNAKNSLHSAAVIFKNPEMISEEMYETFFWKRLQAWWNIDAAEFPYDQHVSADPADRHFSFSLGEEAFFIIGLHPGSPRAARRFKFPAIIFNPHVQFDHLREAGQYEKMKDIVRKRDKQYSGSINPVLHDFGETSEAMQYTGRQYDGQWTCPLKIRHGNNDDHFSPK